MDLFGSFGVNPLIFLKIAIIIFMVLYCVFGIVLIRQVKLMTETLEVGFEKIVTYASYLHMVASVLTLAAAIVLL
jgi:hypothetical protein